ncbi:MAG: GntR family transcriptional regulator [Chloroflexi bacterium]|nr:GntR family transcriptional regulator [Chloroflexota bacterium]
MVPNDWITGKPQVRSLRHDIAEAIRQAIRDGQLAPGARILETDLARRFDVSRQPVREAIRMLEHEGLLTSVPNRGTFVTRVSVEDSIAICDVREELEGLAARLAVRHFKTEDRHRLTEIPNQMRHAALESDINRLIELDLELHDLIVARSNHRLLQDMLASIAVYTRGFIVHTKSYYGTDLIRVADLHERLVSELLSGEPHRAEAAVQEHVREAADRLRSMRDAQQQPASSAGGRRQAE